jgi:hypothetical protein
MSFKINPAILDKIREGAAMCFGISLSQDFEENATVFCLLACLKRQNVRLHTFCRTVKQIQNLELEVLLVPPFSPDLAPSDFHFLGSYKTPLHSHNFRSDKECMTGWHTNQEASSAEEFMPSLNFGGGV